jgi:hypothetical protein
MNVGDGHSQGGRSDGDSVEAEGWRSSHGEDASQSRSRPEQKIWVERAETMLSARIWARMTLLGQIWAKTALLGRTWADTVLLGRTRPSAASGRTWEAWAESPIIDVTGLCVEGGDTRSRTAGWWRWPWDRVAQGDGDWICSNGAKTTPPEEVSTQPRVEQLIGWRRIQRRRGGGQAGGRQMELVSSSGRRHGSRAGGGQQSEARAKAAGADGQGRRSSDAIRRLTTHPGGGEGTEESGITRSGDDDVARGRRRPNLGGGGSVRVTTASTKAMASQLSSRAGSDAHRDGEGWGRGGCGAQASRRRPSGRSAALMPSPCFSSGLGFGWGKQGC